MEFLNDIKEETLLVVSNNVRDKVLSYLNSCNSLINVKLVSFDDLKKYLCFDIDAKTNLYLMDKYGYDIDVSKVLIENMYYIENRQYNSKKLNNLLMIKKDLEANNLLKKDDLFLNKYRDKQVIVFGYDFIDKFNSKLLSNFKSVKIITKDKKEVIKNRVFKFKNIDDEVSFVMKEIMHLIYDGVDINKIKITNVDDDYKRVFKRYSSFYNIPINLNIKNNIFATKIANDYYEQLSNGLSFEEALKNIEYSYDLKQSVNMEIFNKLVGITNDYAFLDYKKELILKEIRYKLLHTYISSDYYNNAIEIVDVRDNVFNDEYLFMVGFNANSVPLVIKDEAFITDNLHSEVSITTSSELNKLIKEAFIQFVSYPRLVITYKEFIDKEECYPSNLIMELDLEVVEGREDSRISYSDEMDKIKLSMMIDNLVKYGIKDRDLDMYFNNYVIPYLEYDNSFKGIDRNNYLNKIKNRLTLSYSSIDNYYKCAFRYYINNVLKLNKYEENFNIFIGKLYHDILSRCLDEGFGFELEYDNYIKTKENTVKESFFLKKLKNELSIVIERVRDLKDKSYLTSFMCEKEINIDKSTSIEVVFMGIIDKIMYKEIDGETLIAIIDYKTGTPNLNLFNIIYGLEMQLATYLYLISKSKLFDNISFVGFYLQKIISNEIRLVKNKSYMDIKKDNLKLLGYSINDYSKIAKFDVGYENSEFIKGMKVTSKGLSSYAKIIDEDNITAIVDLVDKKIEEARDEILKANFIINPKKIGEENLGCSYCENRDICYMRQKDIVTLKEYKDFSFLGGDVNAKMD